MLPFSPPIWGRDLVATMHHTTSGCMLLTASETFSPQGQCVAAAMSRGAVRWMRQQCRQEHRASEHELLQRIKVLWAADIALSAPRLYIATTFAARRRAMGWLIPQAG